MSNRKILGGVLVLAFHLSYGCHTSTHNHEYSDRDANNNASTAMSREQALQLLSTIHENMTYEEISKTLPLKTNVLGFEWQHGGIWCDVPIGGTYYIQLRFERPSELKPLGQCKLNYPPRLRERRD